MKEEGVGINCSELRKAGQGSRIQEGTAAKRGWRSGHLGDAAPS